MSAVIAASNAASVRVVVAVVAGIDEVDLDAQPVAERDTAARGRRRARARVVTTRPPRAPVGQQRRGVHPVGRGVGQRDRVDVGAEHGGDAGPRLGHPLAGRRAKSSEVGAPDVALADRELGHRRGGLGGQRPDRAGVEVDPGRESRKRRPDGRQLLRVGHEGGDHGRMIPTMSGLARPEFLATTEWLADNIGRPEIRVLDLRWRPDGSAPAVYRDRSHPGRGRWSTGGPIWSRTGENGETILLVGPDRMAALAARVGIADGTTVVVYDDSQGLFAARAWWSLLAYGLESVRVLDGGFPAWVAEGREVSNAQSRAERPRVHGPRPEPDAADDGRRPRPARLAGRDAARRPGAGRVPRLRGQHEAARAHPGRGQRPGRGDQQARAASGCATAPSCATSSTGRTSLAAAGWSATTDRASRPPSSRSC